MSSFQNLSWLNFQGGSSALFSSLQRGSMSFSWQARLARNYVGCRISALISNRPLFFLHSIVLRFDRVFFSFPLLLFWGGGSRELSWFGVCSPFFFFSSSIMMAFFFSSLSGRLFFFGVKPDSWRCSFPLDSKSSNFYVFDAAAGYPPLEQKRGPYIEIFLATLILPAFLC